MEHWTEDIGTLSEPTKDRVRALKTVIEELEAVMYYEQRADVTKDLQLKEIFIHNRNEEMEHACMTMEWIRRNMENWDLEMNTYFFTDGNIISTEASAGSEGEKGTSTGLNIGSLKVEV